MAQHGLSATDTQTLMDKLRDLRALILCDQETIEKQKKELHSKEEALSQIYQHLQKIKQDLSNTDSLSETEFRTATSKYLQTIRNDIDYLRQNRSAATLIKKPLRVVITGAAGQVGYSLVPLLASGQAFGLDQPLVLTLLEIPPALNALKGSVLETEDGAYPLLEAVIPTTDPAVAFKDVDYAILVGGFPRGAGMERKDLLAKNSPIFQSMGEALEKYAKDTCRVLVVANPANTNCLVCSRFAKKLPKRNFAALTRLDQNRATAQLAHKLGVPVRSVSNVIIWGNHSNTQVPDAGHAVITVDGVRKSVQVEEKWERSEFTQSVQQRGKAILEARGLTSALSAANAIKDCIHDWHFGTPEGDHVALAVYSDGSHYGIAKDIFYSMPVVCKNGNYSVVADLKINEDVHKLMKKSEEELLAERHEAGLDKH